jgi:hypothetical protein
VAVPPALITPGWAWRPARTPGWWPAGGAALIVGFTRGAGFIWTASFAWTARFVWIATFVWTADVR